VFGVKLQGIEQAEIVHHKTHEIINIIGGICDLIITMNITISLLRRVASPEKTILYFASASREPKKFVKERFFVGSLHAKIYRTDEKVVISTSNLSLSSFDEVSVVFPRSPELDKFVEEFKRNLKLKNTFYQKFW